MSKRIEGCGKKQERERFDEDRWFWYCNEDRLCSDCKKKQEGGE